MLSLALARWKMKALTGMLDLAFTESYFRAHLQETALTAEGLSYYRAVSGKCKNRNK